MFKRPYLPAFIWLTMVTILSVIPSVPLPKFNLFSADKLGHAAAYGLLTLLMLRGFRKVYGHPPRWQESMVIFCLSSGYGILMEFVQWAFFPARFFEVDDMIANAFGAAMAIPGYWLLRRIGWRWW